MQRFKKQAELGLRWIRCGWRLFRRNPWLLGGMGVCASAVVGVLAHIPFVGTPFIALLAPALLGGFFIAVDTTAKQKLRLPPALRLAAVKQSPRELVAVLRDENRLLQAVMLGLASMTIVVLADILAWTVAGNVWANRADISLAALPRLTIAGLFVLSIYLFVAAALVYALPLSVLDKEPLVPAVVRSLKASAHYAFAFVVPLTFLFLPLVLGGATSWVSPGLGYLLGFAAGAVALPVFVAGIYCSYRTIFTVTEVHPMSAVHVGKPLTATLQRR